MINRKSLKNSLRFLEKLNYSRIVNFLLLLYSYYWSKYSKKAIQKGLPVSISIEPTTSCNLRCPECPSGLRSFTRPTGMLEEKLFQKVVNEMAPHLLYLNLYFQGEPFLHPQFTQFIKYASSKKIYTSTSTNAHYLNDENCRKTIESGLDRLIVSIDGITQETYQSYRVGGSLEKVIEGTKNIINWKNKLKSSSPHLVFQFLVVKPNEHQVEEVKLLAEELGVDEVVLKTAQIYNYQSGSDLIPDNQNYSRYRLNKDGSWTIKNSLDNHCWKMWHSSVITWDGKVVPCCFDKDASHPMGSVKEKTFQEIWKGEKYLQFRKAILRSRSEIEICKNCSEGTKVWA